MCERCALVVRKYYPSLPDAEFGDFLMATTAFPMGDAETIERQVLEMWEQTDGTIAAAYAYAQAEFDKSFRECSGNAEYQSWCSGSDATNCLPRVNNHGDR